MYRHISAFALVVLFVVPLIGCNTEQMWVRQSKPQAQTTSMDSPDGIDLPDIKIVDAQEVDIVENLLTHRAMYRRMLVALRDYYRDNGFNNKRKWAESELADLDRVKPFKYILSAEVPVTSLHPQHAIVEADEMYQRGLDLMKKGGHGLPALYRQDLMEEAFQTFTELITKYPSSDKIDDAAFCCGEILKEYFSDQERLAVKWYQRAREWDPKTPHPALFQAAVVYDYRLHDRAKALELYHRVLEEETQNKSNTAFASRRIHELTEGVEQIHQPRRPADMNTTARPIALTGDTSADPKEDTSANQADSNGTSPSDELVPIADLGPDGDE